MISTNFVAIWWSMHSAGFVSTPAPHNQNNGPARRALTTIWRRNWSKSLGLQQNFPSLTGQPTMQ
ncbi:MAG: hypothetical protein AAFY14_02350, partial [Pseudomonadota bacterium]